MRPNPSFEAKPNGRPPGPQSSESVTRNIGSPLPVDDAGHGADNTATFQCGAGEDAAMTTTELLAARINILSLGLQEVARALAPAQVAQVTGSLRRRLVQLNDPAMTLRADKAASLELIGLLSALAQRPSP